jgi:hypothetical protein
MAERKEHWLYTSKYEWRGKLACILTAIWLLATLAGAVMAGVVYGFVVFLLAMAIVLIAHMEVMAWLVRYLVSLADLSIKDGKVLSMQDLSSLAIMRELSERPWSWWHR